MERQKGFTPVSEQLELELDDERALIPWEGRSPRGLTKVGLGLFLRQEPPKKHARIRCDSSQLELFVRQEGPPQYEGAPLLLPLLTRR